MKMVFDSKFKTDVMLIGQGEFYASCGGEVVSTTLGSCVSICIFDATTKVGGMNHYMLPEAVNTVEDVIFGHAKYGIVSMELLINECIKLGAHKERLLAKIFGGADMFSSSNLENSIGVGKQNIDFAYRYLELEGIKIQSEDLAKDHARKIYFDTATGFVKLYRIGVDKRKSIIDSEIAYEKKVINENVVEKEDNEKITFF